MKWYIRLSYVLRFYEPPALGRWCHKTSEKYQKTCDPFLKMAQETDDNSISSETMFKKNSI